MVRIPHTTSRSIDEITGRYRLNLFNKILLYLKLKMTDFDKLVSYFLETNELGHYVESKELVLYDFKRSNIRKLRKRIENMITSDFKIYISDLNTDGYSNIIIRDIDE